MTARSGDTDPAAAAFERFLRGEQSLADLQSALAELTAVDAGAAPRLHEIVDELYRSGRLPVQVHDILRQTLAGVPRPPAATSSNEGGDLRVDDAMTRVRPAPEADRTRLQPRTPDTPAGAPPPPTQPPPTGSASMTGSDWAHPENWQSRHGDVLGPGSVVKERFLLESVLGEGGMGVVYRALDRRRQEARDPDPYVAIKILSDEFRRHPKSLMALQREARKSQALAHPNVITVYDFERDGTTVYMTMELLDGEPLNHVIAANDFGGLPRDEALPVIRGMAAALAYAHQKGIVHADFKPGNVFLTRRGDVKVLDFGIARAVPDELHPQPADEFDAAELEAMTPSYASPEMLRGEPPDPADDVYGLAVVAYELLTGRHPFDRLPADRALRAGKRAPPVPGLPRRQRRALARGLSFERKARQPHAGAFLKELDGPSPLKRAAYAAALVALAGVAAYGLYESNQLRPDVPWEALSAPEQQAFTSLVEEGRRALDFADRGVGSEALNDAFDRFANAYGIHRNNPDAIEGLEGVAERFLDLMSAADARDRQNIVRKLYCQDYLRSYRRVLTACDEVFGRRQCDLAEMRCASADEDR